mgnify:CR=1 FL=1
MSDSLNTFEYDEQQGLILKLNYREELSSYCTLLMSKSDNNSTSIARMWAYSNTVTGSVVNSLSEHSQYGAITPVVSNSEDHYQQSKQAYPKWRHTNHKIKSIYIQKALAKRAEEQNRNQYAITMRFSPKLARKIMADGAAHIQEALTRQLKRSLGYAPDMWLHLEAVVSEKPGKNDNYKIDGKGSVSRSHGVLHMHGVMAVNKEDLNVVKCVVRNINNSTSSIFQNHELHLEPISDAIGWVNYCHKRPALNNMLLNGVTRYSRTKILGSVAQVLYEADRRNHKTKHATTYGKRDNHA